MQLVTYQEANMGMPRPALHALAARRNWLRTLPCVRSLALLFPQMLLCMPGCGCC